MTTAQVKNFQEIAKQAGLKRGDYSARSPIDKHGEYKPLEVSIRVRTTEEQCKLLAAHYDVTVYKVDGVVKWQAYVGNGKAGLTIHEI